MKKLKIYVYAISKNEQKFVKRWVESMSEADKIFVLDTGSTDNTVNELRKYGVDVFEEKIIPWRFDTARNKSLELIPEDADVCVCTDLDEIFEKGWREKLEKNYIKGYRVNYTYNWHIDENGKPDVSFILNKIHPKKGYKWTHPVHEVLTPIIKEKFITIKDIVLNHYPDTTKSRSNYLKLLELSVAEDPEDDRNMHYLGREYMYYKKWEKCINTLKKHINLETATWNLERAASMRYIARSYYNLHNEKETEFWYKCAIKEADNVREGYVELGLFYYNIGKWIDSIYYLLKALSIKDKDLVYINEVFCWDNTIDDILSINYYNIGLYDISLYHINKAIEYKANDRLIKNKELIEKVIKTSN